MDKKAVCTFLCHCHQWRVVGTVSSKAQGTIAVQLVSCWAGMGLAPSAVLRGRGAISGQQAKCLGTRMIL